MTGTTLFPTHEAAMANPNFSTKGETQGTRQLIGE